MEMKSFFTFARFDGVFIDKINHVQTFQFCCFSAGMAETNIFGHETQKQAIKKCYISTQKKLLTLSSEILFL